MNTSTLLHPSQTGPATDCALDELLQAWTANDDLRRRGAELADRFEARGRLDSARLSAARARSTQGHNIPA